MTPTVDFFISYTGKDKAWAEWIAWMLERAGYSTLIQAWDFAAASNFILKMQQGATDSVRTIAVITPDYFKSAFTQPEWAVAFASDPTSQDGKLIAVRVVDVEPPGYFKTINYIDLVGVEESAAQEKLVNAIKSIVERKRLKPATPPVFPGSAQPKSSGVRPPFPGTKVQREIVHNLPFSPNPFFTGREPLLKVLHDALHRKEDGAIAQPQAVHGLGGVGKTQLAVEYAWANQADYDAILWAGAESPGELQANVATLAAILRLDEAEAPEQEVRVAAVLRWFQEHRRWLLILDNADPPEAQQVVGALLPTGLPGHVIFTSRRTSWPIGVADLEVRVLAPEAAEEFLIERTEKARFQAGPPAEARAVAEELGCLPLAIEQAAAYLVHLKVTFAEYRRRLAESRPRLLGFPSQGGTGYQKTVATTWLVTEAQLSPRARAVLQLAALLAPDEIPRAMFTQGGKVIEEAMRLLPKDMSAGTAVPARVALAAARGSSLSPREERAGREPERGAAEETGLRSQAKNLLSPALSSIPNGGEGGNPGPGADVEEALAELAGYSLIELGVEGFTLHRLLQAVLHDRLDPDTRRPWVDHAVQLVNDFAPATPSDVRTWPVWDRVRPHATTILREAWDQANPTAAVLMSQLGTLFHAKALDTEAEPLYRRALALDEKSFGPEHARVAICLNNLAQLLQATKRLPEAEPLMRRSLALDEQSFGPEHPKVAVRLNNLAALLQDTNRLVEAEAMMRRALALCEKSFDPEHPQTAICLGNLAGLLQSTNRLAAAEPLMRRALAIDEKNFGAEHPNVAIDTNNLAQLLTATNRQAEAEPLMRRALAIDEKNFGLEHPSVARDLNNLARLLHNTNRLGEAEPLMRRALALDEKIFGPDHRNVARDLNNLAMLLRDMNRPAEAEPLMRRALEIRE